MKLRSLLVAACCVAVLALTVNAAKEISLDGIKCAMNPKAAAKATKFVEYKGGKVFFCCDNCPKGFASKVSEDKLVQAKGNHQLIATGQVAQTKCPLAGRPCKAETAIKVAGAKIAFCCENCQAKAKKMEGNDQLVALFGDAAYDKAGFKIKKEEFTSEGAEDPNKKADDDGDETTSEGAKDPNESDDKDDPETKSDGAKDPNEAGDKKDAETTSEGADEPK